MRELSRADLIVHLRMYLDGQWTAGDLSGWASETEMAAHIDQLDYEAAYSNEIATVLFDLGTPELNGEPTGQRVRSWITQIEAWRS